MRRARFTIAAALCLVAAAPAAARAADMANWDRGDQKAVVRAGVMTPLPDGGFAGDRQLSAPDTRAALQAVAARAGVQPANAPSGTPSVATFDRLLVDQLCLADLAA